MLQHEIEKLVRSEIHVKLDRIAREFRSVANDHDTDKTDVNICNVVADVLETVLRNFN